MSACSKATLAAPAAATAARAWASESGETSIEVMRASGLVAASVTVCAPTPQPASSTRAAGRVRGVVVQQLDERPGLIVEPLLLPRVVAVDVGFGHVGRSSRRAHRGAPHQWADYRCEVVDEADLRFSTSALYSSSFM